MTDSRDPAKERAFDAEMVELALGAGAENPMEYRRGMFDALNVVRWGLLADPSDGRAAAQSRLFAVRYTQRRPKYSPVVHIEVPPVAGCAP